MYSRLSFLILQVLLVVRFDSDRILRLLMRGSSHYCKGTLADLQANLEFFPVERLLLRILPTSIVDVTAEVFELGHLYFLLHFLPFQTILVPGV